MSKTIQIASLSQFKDVLKSSIVVVVDFYADWCGPCKQIAPIYEQLSQRLSAPSSITFAKVNTETQKEIASKYNVTALPTFMVFRQGEPAETIKGADGQKLQRVVRELATMATGLGSSSGSSGSSWRSSELPKGYKDISDQVDVKGLELLNADSDFSGVRVLFEGSKPSGLDTKGKASGGESKKDWVESDTDEQLMLYMPFQAILKVHSLQLTSLPPPPTEDEDSEAPMRPKTIHIYTNRPHILGFDEAEDIPPTQTITLAASDWDSTGTANIALRFVKFQNITSLVLFIVDGDGSSERVRLDRVRIIGETGEKRDQGKLEKIDHDHD